MCHGIISTTSILQKRRKWGTAIADDSKSAALSLYEEYILPAELSQIAKAGRRLPAQYGPACI